MPKPRKVDAKTAELDRSGTLNPIPRRSWIRFFRTTPYFDHTSAGPLRDAASASHRRSVDQWRRRSPSACRARRSIMHRPRSPRRGSPVCCRGCAARRGATSSQRSPPTHPCLEERRPNCHDGTLRPGDSTTLRDQRSSPQSRTRSAEQNKTSQSALTDSIPARATADYEILRGQLFGVEPPALPPPDSVS